MRESDLKRLFKRLILVTATPIPFVAACSGETQGTSDSTGGTAPGGQASTGGGGSSSTTTAKGLGGFLGTVVMTGGTQSAGGSTSVTTAKGLGGFMGTIALVGGTMGSGGANTGGATVHAVPCPSAGTGGSGNTGGSGIIVGCGTPTLCVQADLSATGTGALDSTLCSSLCGAPVLTCEALTAGNPTIVQCNIPCTGRRPSGLTEVQSFCDDELGQYFSEVAHLEAASVAAFRALGRQLTVFGAPRRLRRGAKRAARDEIHHARLGRALAKRFGGRYVPPSVSAQRDVNLETLARENATEGCVRETYGALLATYQARQAEDPEVRKAMTQIARDETRHAAIAWAIARWVEPKLDAKAQARVREARLRAAQELTRELGYEATAKLQSAAGVPAANVAQQLARSLASELWV